MRIVVTGGLGFIASNFIRYWKKKDPNDEIINVDKVTYASLPVNKQELEKIGSYSFIKADIADFPTMLKIAKDSDCIVNFAAESHVDNSIKSPDSFINSNILGVYSLLKVALETGIRLHQVSTDEVFGTLDLGSRKKFTDSSKYNPRNPYSATKAASDFLIRAFYNTYRINATISNCSNNYGPYQHPEKLIPKSILYALNDMKIPVYGNGSQVRDWINVSDHCAAIRAIMTKGEPGKTYLVGGNGEMANIDIIRMILKKLKKPEDLIQHVADRPGHDVRYAIMTSKSLREMGWRKSVPLDKGLNETIVHYKSYRSSYEKLLNLKGEYH